MCVGYVDDHVVGVYSSCVRGGVLGTLCYIVLNVVLCFCGFLPSVHSFLCLSSSLLFLYSLSLFALRFIIVMTVIVDIIIIITVIVATIVGVASIISYKPSLYIFLWIQCRL